MKLKNYFLPALMMFAATFTACTKPEAEELVPSVKVQQEGVNIVKIENVAATAIEVSIDVIANVGWTITDDAEWLTIEPATHENATEREDKVAVTLKLTANETIGVARTANITVTAGDLSAEIVLTQKGADEPEPAKTTIADVLAAEAEGEFTVENLTVVAINAKSAMLTDGENYILAYLNAVPAVKVGEIVTVAGTTSTYGGLRQFGSNVVLTKTGDDDSFVQPAPAEMSAADLLAVVDAPEIKYVTYSGSLLISGNYYNITVEGLEGAQGSISYPIEGLVPADYNGADVTVTGYITGITGSSTKYINTIVTSIRKEGEVEFVETAIKNITEAGNYIVKGATVVSVYSKGLLVSDAEMNAILVYLGAASDATIGDVVDLKGVVSVRNDNLQFGAGTEVTIGANSPLEVPYAAITASQIEDYTMGYFPGTVEGTLTISGNYYNVAIEGTTKVGSISNPAEGVIDAALDGKKIKITGWSIGLSKSGETIYFNMMANSVEEVADEPIGPQTYSWTMADGDMVGGADFIADDGTVYEPISGKGTPALDWIATGTLTTEGEYAVSGGTSNNRFKIGTGTNLVNPYKLTTKGLSGKKITKVTVWASTSSATLEEQLLTVTVGGTTYIDHVQMTKSTTDTKKTGVEMASAGDGTSTGDVVITFDNTAAFYLYTITIDYENQ